MRISFDVPDWAVERHITVFAGQELIAAVPFGSKKLRLKTQRCAWCGKCCEPCDHLKQDGSKMVCDLGIDRPFRCASGDPCMGTPVPDCCQIRYQEIDLDV